MLWVIHTYIYMLLVGQMGVAPHYTFRMEIITAGEKQLTVCPHCKGSSLCQFSTVSWREEIVEQDTWFYFLSCATCGKGAEKEEETDLLPNVCSQRVASILTCPQADATSPDQTNS
jgi:hypothetical protein